ncbi:MAG: ANTAR domain-containing protein [Chloroflexi bacterium]|nr:ANTAR domain-containing protein [Chloroflexota bacterium]
MPVYRVIIVDEDAASRRALREILAAAGHTVLAETGSGAEALTELRSHHPDAVFVELASFSDPAAATAVRENPAAGIAILADSTPEECQRAVEAGTAGWVLKPFQPLQVLASLGFAVALHSELRRLQSDLHAAQEALDTRKLVERAKSLLMDAYEITEAEAFRRIQSQSMNTRKSMKEVAQSLVNTHVPRERP